MVVAPSFSRAEADALVGAQCGRPARRDRAASDADRAAQAAHARTTRRSPTARFFRSRRRLRLACSSASTWRRSRREFRAQFEAFADAFGRPPDFVDGHQHVHLFPQVRQAALETASWIAPHAWVRQCGSSLPLHRRLTDPKGLLIDWLSREFRAARRKPRHRHQSGLCRHLYVSAPNADFAALFPGLSGRPAGRRPGDVPSRAMSMPNSSGSTRSRPCASGNMPIFAVTHFPRRLKAHGLTLN